MRLTEGDAFGTGLHATTALCLEALEDLFDAVLPGRLLHHPAAGSDRQLQLAEAERFGEHRQRQVGGLSRVVTAGGALDQVAERGTVAAQALAHPATAGLPLRCRSRRPPVVLRSRRCTTESTMP